MTRTTKQPISLASEDWVESMKTHIDVVIKGNRPAPKQADVTIVTGKFYATLNPQLPWDFDHMMATCPLRAATCGEER